MSKGTKHWAEFAKTLAFHRLMGVIWGVVAVVSVVTTVWLLNASPIVVVKECGKKTFHRGIKEDVPLTGEDVAGFAEGFVRALHSWQGFHPEKIAGGIACMGTEGLRSRLGALLEKDPRNKARKKGSLSQYVGAVVVELKERVTVVGFDRIFAVDGVPMVSREKVELHIIRGNRTACNPVGFYVNGIRGI